MARAPISIRRTSIGHLYQVMPRQFGDGQHRQETQHPPGTHGLLARKLFRAFARTVPKEELLRTSYLRTPRPRCHLWICQRVRGASAVSSTIGRRLRAPCRACSRGASAPLFDRCVTASSLLPAAHLCPLPGGQFRWATVSSWPRLCENSNAISGRHGELESSVDSHKLLIVREKKSGMPGRVP